MSVGPAGQVAKFQCISLVEGRRGLSTPTTQICISFDDIRGRLGNLRKIMLMMGNPHWGCSADDEKRPPWLKSNGVGKEWQWMKLGLNRFAHFSSTPLHTIANQSFKVKRVLCVSLAVSAVYHQMGSSVYLIQSCIKNDLKPHPLHYHQ